jgi:hypothetical protein
MKAGCPQRLSREAQPLREAQGWGVPAAEQGDHPIQVVDLDLPANIGAAEAELARGAKKVPDGSRRADGQGGTMPRRWHTGPVPELNREGTIWKGALDAAAQPIGA